MEVGKAYKDNAKKLTIESLQEVRDTLAEFQYKGSKAYKEAMARQEAKAKDMSDSIPIGKYEKIPEPVRLSPNDPGLDMGEKN